MVLIFAVFVIFLVILTFFLRKNSRVEAEAQEQFWAKEREANSVRKKDLSSLAYLSVPLDTLPVGVSDDSELSRLRQELLTLSGRSILNLNGISNTDLKMTYGTANLDFLSECDENFTSLILTLQDYGRRLHELGLNDEAETVLQYAVDCGSDISATYLLLAQLYRDRGNLSGVQSLTAAAKQLTSSRREAILEKLNSMNIL